MSLFSSTDAAIKREEIYCMCNQGTSNANNSLCETITQKSKLLGIGMFEIFAIWYDVIISLAIQYLNDIFIDMDNFLHSDTSK